MTTTSKYIHKDNSATVLVFGKQRLTNSSLYEFTAEGKTDM